MDAQRVQNVVIRLCLLMRQEGEIAWEDVSDETRFFFKPTTYDSTKDALRKIWKELGTGAEWIIDADLKDFFGSVVHEKLLTLVAQRISDGRVLRLIERMLKAGVLSEGQRLPTEQGTPQGGVVAHGQRTSNTL